MVGDIVRFMYDVIKKNKGNNMLDEYQKLRIDLGSIQYLTVAQMYTNLVNENEKLLYTDLEDIINDPRAFKKEMGETFQAIYRMYREIQLSKSYKDLDQELIDDADLWDEEIYEEVKEYISDSSLQFPVNVRENTDMVKLALVEWFAYVRNRAWDLWSAVSYLTGNLDTINQERDYSENENIGRFLYVLREVYGFTDSQIQKIAGDFDT